MAAGAAPSEKFECFLPIIRKRFRMAYEEAGSESGPCGPAGRIYAWQMAFVRMAVFFGPAPVTH